MPAAGAAPMIGFDTTTLVLGFVFSAIGFVAYRYGRSMELVSPIVIGLVLMIYPIFVRDAVWLLTVGVGLTASLWFFRD